MLGHAGEGGLHFDFLHPKKQEVPAQAKLKKVPLVAAVVALFAIAGGVFYWQGPAKGFARRHELEEQIREVEAEIKANKPFINMVEAAQEFEDQQIIWIDEVRNLVEQLPDSRKVVLEGLDLRQRDRTMKMEIRASDSLQGGKIVEKFGDLHPEGGKGRSYAATRGRTSLASKGKYRHQGTITVQIVGDQQGSKRRPPGRRSQPASETGP